MARYRSIQTRIWADPDFQEYPPEGKLLFLYLISNPNCTESGIYPVTIRTMANETGLTTDQVETALNKLKNVVYDPKTHCVFVINFLQYNGSGRPENIATSILNDCRTTRKSSLWKAFAERYPNWRKSKIGYELGAAVKQILANEETDLPWQKPKTKASPNNSNSNSNSNSISKEQLANGLSTVDQQLDKSKSQMEKPAFKDKSSAKHRVCERCEHSFMPLQPEHTLCLDCFKKSKSGYSAYVSCNNPKCTLEGPPNTMRLDENGICYVCREMSTEPYYGRIR